ncbi:MAG: tyrosine-type recombinase/integrase, partial [Planctomycetota bacterium]
MKVVFELAKKRKQLDEHPLQHLKPPKTSKNIKIRTYSEDECNRLIKEASNFQRDNILEWDLVITLALTTGMRKSELLNMVWNDIDFGDMTIEVHPKENTDYTWEWQIKDYDE